MKTLLKPIGQKWYFLIIAAIAIITQVWFQLNLPEFMGNIQTLITYKETDTLVGPIIGGTITLLNPLTGQNVLIDNYLSQGELVSQILNQGFWMLIVCVIILVCAFIQFHCASSLGAYVGRYLRDGMYKKVNELSLSQYNKFGTATLITRTTNDIEQIKNLVIMATRILIMAPTYITIGLIKTLTLDDPGPRLALVLLIIVPLILIIFLAIFIVVGPSFKKMQTQVDDITVVLRENLTGIRVVRAYNQQEEENKKFDEQNTKFKKLIEKVGKVMAVASPLVTIMFNIAFIGIYAFGFYLLTEIKVTGADTMIVIGNQITTIAVVAQYSMQIMNSFLMAAMILIMMPQASVSLKRINEVLNLDTSKDEEHAKKAAIEGLKLYKNRKLHEFKENYKNSHNGATLSISLLTDKYSKMSKEEVLKDPQYEDFARYKFIEEQTDKAINALQTTTGEEYYSIFEKILENSNEKGVVEFKNVSFQYPDSNIPTVEHISFKTKPGTTTAIIGSTGSGKSSLINLIPRFFDASDGQILLDGVDIRDLPEKVLRNHIGFVPQTAVLFSGTIKDNIKYGKENATDEEIMEALRIAQTEHFISKLEGGIDYRVSQGGKNFSGGQKQRLAIARCLVRKPEIYVFDDSFSALDFKTDARLRHELKQVTKNSSVIVVAQRVSSILDADNIIVLNEGKCVGQGTHAELLQNCEVYQDIVKSQLDKDEVEKTIQLVKAQALEGGN